MHRVMVSVRFVYKCVCLFEFQGNTTQQKQNQIVRYLLQLHPAPVSGDGTAFRQNQHSDIVGGLSCFCLIHGTRPYTRPMPMVRAIPYKPSWLMSSLLMALL